MASSCSPLQQVEVNVPGGCTHTCMGWISLAAQLCHCPGATAPSHCHLAQGPPGPGSHAGCHTCTSPDIHARALPEGGVRKGMGERTGQIALVRAASRHRPFSSLCPSPSPSVSFPAARILAFPPHLLPHTIPECPPVSCTRRQEPCRPQAVPVFGAGGWRLRLAWDSIPSPPTPLHTSASAPLWVWGSPGPPCLGSHRGDRPGDQRGRISPRGVGW